jgi:hypothetical protein
MKEEEEMSEEDIQKQIEQDDFVKMRRKVQSITVTELNRLNSLK